MAEQLDPEEWAEIMDEAFDVFTAPIDRYEGTVARLMGDSILAFFGAPVAHEDDPQRAVLAGLDILSGIQPLREEMKLEYGLDFDVRIGINTGPVVVAEIGSQIAGEYTAMGDAVNLAARMEQSASPGTIRISEDTYRWIAPLFNVEELGLLEIKGKREPLNVYQVVSRKAVPGRLRGIEGHRVALVGREVEVKVLMDAVTKVQRGRGQIVSLIGDAGIGKSRLIEETHSLWDQDARREKLWIESRGISYDTTLPYGLFRQILRQICGAELEDPPDVVRKKIQELLDQIFVEDNVERSQITQAVEILLKVDEKSDQSLPVGEDLKRVLSEGVRSLLYRIGSAMPLVLVCDDLHWADQTSIDLLVYLFELSELIPLLFLTAFRPYRQSPGWRIKNEAETNYPNRYDQISLQPLSNTDSGLLVSNLLTVADLPESFRQSILNKAEGNPFFVEEVVRTLIENGTVVFDESKGVWVPVRAVEEINIPDNLQALILARIDRLENEARQTLQLASVIGRSFYYRVLEVISGKISELDRQLNTLERMELIEEGAILPEREYLFRHELTRDAAYKSILRRQRQKFHKSVAEAIEVMFANHIDEEAHRLAYHFYQARDYTHALDYYILAGDKSAGLYANTEAVDHYSHALEIARTIPITKDKLLHVYSALGRVYEVSGDFDSALSTYRALEKQGEEQGDREIILAALIPQATIHSIPSDHVDQEQGQVLSDRALQLARELGDFRAESKVLWNLLLLEELIFGNKGKAIEFGEQAIAIARKHQLQEELAYALHDITRAYFETGQVEDAWAAHEESNKLWRELNNLPLLADNLGAVAQALFHMGDFEQALAKATEGIAVSRKIGNQWGQAYNLAMRGLAHMELGQPSAAIRDLREGLPLAHQANFKAGELIATGVISWMYGTLGDVDHARAWDVDFRNRLEGLDRFAEYGVLWEGLLLDFGGDSRKAFELLDESIRGCCLNVLDDYMGPLLAHILSTITIHSGEYQTALKLSEEAIGSMQDLHLRAFLPDLQMVKGVALVELGDIQAGLESLYNAYHEAVSTGARRSVLFVLAELIEAEMRNKNQAKADELRREGKEIVEYISSEIDDPELQIIFLKSTPVQVIMGEG